MSRADIALRLPHPAARSGGVLLGCRSSPWLIGRRGGRPPPSDEETVVTSAAPTHQDLSRRARKPDRRDRRRDRPGGGRGGPGRRLPRAGIDALARAGVLGAGSATEVGGAGRRARRRRRDRGAARRGVRLDGDGRAACTTRRSPVLEAHGPARRARGDRRRPPPEHAGVLRGRARAATSGRRWAPRARDGDGVRLDARKSWVTSAGEADSYVWSSRPLARATGR